ncbi:DUF4143 domain-containing protein [Acidaminobacter sp. JC074]|uniref:ATP-binding protein n=1 Tax=Acidaminobacter sp. JC074 TaxID=2530199 RepID=UPI001F0F93F8|nr:AAA family ATPase [Acidaminobacter sp. JC074]MCH4886950.1 DUF4143 domain-containing protein [Acidaminobacter sp. JC074]
MKRAIESYLKAWKSMNNDRLPLLIYGARQVGKTFSLLKFAKEEYDTYVYINFDSDLIIQSYFNENISPKNLIDVIEKYYGLEIKPKRTLIIFDEIQASERALASLKYFAEEASEYHIVAAGSLLGVAVNREKYNFPVGKVFIKHMFPMSFKEYLMACSEELLLNRITNAFNSNQPLEKVLHEKALKYYQSYIITGGMPAVVKNALVEDKVIEDEVLRNLIIESYTSDMSKYQSASDAVKAKSAYQSIPAQLAKENTKFQYKLIKTGGRASLYGDAIDWLIHSGLVLKCGRISEGKIPIAVYEDLSSFKLYNSDIGILSQQSGLTDYSMNRIKDKEALGGITENYVACELTSLGYPLYYWTSKGTAEVDFIISVKGMPIPVEVKASTNTRSRSLSEYIKRYNPAFSIRISQKNFGFENNIKSVPLYAVYNMTSENLSGLLDRKKCNE